MINTLSTKKHPSSTTSIINSTEPLKKKNNANYTQKLPENRKRGKGMCLNPFYDHSRIFKLKLSKDSQERKVKANLSHDYRCEHLFSK